jgi:hypothetical protein
MPATSAGMTAENAEASGQKAREPECEAVISLVVAGLDPATHGFLAEMLQSRGCPRRARA